MESYRKPTALPQISYGGREIGRASYKGLLSLFVLFQGVVISIFYTKTRVKLR